MSSSVDIELVQGDSVQLTFVFTDENGEPYNIPQSGDWAFEAHGKYPPHHAHMLPAKASGNTLTVLVPPPISVKMQNGSYYIIHSQRSPITIKTYVRGVMRVVRNV